MERMLVLPDPLLPINNTCVCVHECVRMCVCVYVTADNESPLFNLTMHFCLVYVSVYYTCIHYVCTCECVCVYVRVCMCVCERESWWYPPPQPKRLHVDLLSVGLRSYTPFSSSLAAPSFSLYCCVSCGAYTVHYTDSSTLLQRSSALTAVM